MTTNTERPHSALGHLTHGAYARKVARSADQRPGKTTATASLWWAPIRVGETAVRIIHPPKTELLDLNAVLAEMTVLFRHLCRDGQSFRLRPHPAPLFILADRFATEGEAVQRFGAARSRLMDNEELKGQGELVMTTRRFILPPGTSWTGEFSSKATPGDYCTLSVGLDKSDWRIDAVFWPYACGAAATQGDPAPEALGLDLRDLARRPPPGGNRRQLAPPNPSIVMLADRPVSSREAQRDVSHLVLIEIAQRCHRIARSDQSSHWRCASPDIDQHDQVVNPIAQPTRKLVAQLLAIPVQHKPGHV